MIVVNYHDWLCQLNKDQHVLKFMCSKRNSGQQNKGGVGGGGLKQTY